jgi:hypothetical protein
MTLQVMTEVHIIEISEIEHHPKDVKASADMIDVDTSKQVSPMNLHVSKVTPQVLGIVNNILLMGIQLLKVLEV